MTTEIAKALMDSPDFIRLGLMLALERRPVEPRARAMFIHARQEALERSTAVFRELTPTLTDAQVQQLTIYAMAGADGLFIAKEVAGDSVDLVALFEVHAQALYATAMRMVAERTNR